MSECTDGRFERMLHHYELGMLEGDDLTAMEVHLLECDSCFETVQQFRQESWLLRNDREVRSIISDTAGGVESDKHEEPDISGTSSSWSRWRTIIPTSVVAAAVLVLLILQPWQIEIRPTDEAIAAEDRLAVMYFENLTDVQDSARLGEIFTNLLITDLSQSEYMQVVSSQRLQDVLRLMGRDNPEVADPTVATEAARRANARWFLTGSIVQTEPSFVVTAQIVDVVSGDVLASRRIDGEPGEDVFAIVDRLSVVAKDGLALPLAARSEPDGHVADATTHSEEAYRLYLEGVDSYHKFYFAEARQSLKQALEIDSTLAMAYYYMAALSDSKYIFEAIKYIDKVPPIQKIYIEVSYAAVTGEDKKVIDMLRKLVVKYPDEKQAYNLLGSQYKSRGMIDEAIAAFHNAIKIDPLFKRPYNELAYIYASRKQMDSALWAINKYIETAPGEANPYDSRGDIYRMAGMDKEAMQSYREALERKPDYTASLEKLGFMCVFDQQYEEADSCFRVMSVRGLTAKERALGRFFRVLVPYYAGRFDETLRLTEDNASIDRVDFGAEIYPTQRYVRALVYRELGDLGQAISEMAHSMEIVEERWPSSVGYYQGFYCQLLAENGQLQEARDLAASLKPKKDKKSKKKPVDYLYAMGAIERISGNADSAIAYFKRGAESEWHYYVPECRYPLAELLLEEGQYEEAIKYFKKLLADKSSYLLYSSIPAVKSYYYLGLAYERLEDYDKSIAHYEKFLDIWKNADSGIAAVDDARERVRRLKSKS